MNNAKMWLVVPPAVGVPVFLGPWQLGPSRCMSLF